MPVSSAARLGEQVGEAQNAWRKSMPLFGQALQVGGGHGIAVRLDIAPGVMGMEVEDIRAVQRISPED